MTWEVAIKQLHDLHLVKYNALLDPTRSFDWQIPLVDNEYDLSRTGLGFQYINRCREINEAGEFATSRGAVFMSYSSCCGVHKHFVGEKSLSTVMNKAISEAVHRKIVPAVNSRHKVSNEFRKPFGRRCGTTSSRH